MKFSGIEEKRRKKKENFGDSKPELRIIKLGNDDGANKNLTVYESGDDIIIVDCGISFPDSDLHGVDVVIPDFTYLIENREKIRGLFVSHGHEDHFGAVPYLLTELPDIPVFANALVQGFIRGRLEDRGSKNAEKTTQFHLINVDTEEIDLGNFKVSGFRLNHSVPFSLGFAIRTPQGLVLHAADYKVDYTPIIDDPIDLGVISDYGREGVLCLLSDCLGADHDGYVASESSLNHTFQDLFSHAGDRQILVTTISSNLSRMYQIIEAAIAHGRKVVFAGRSIRQNSEVALDLGYLPFDEGVFIEERKAKDYDQSTLVYIIAGCYGQPNSGLSRAGRGENDNVILEENALVIFSADPSPPGVQEDVERALHELTVAGVEVIYKELQEDLHVGGHGMKGDLTTVTHLSQAKYYIPIGGNAAKMRAYTSIVESLGHPRENSLELLEGDSVVFRNGEAYPGEHVNVEDVYISGRHKEELSAVVMQDRELLADDGVFFVIVPSTKNGKHMPDKVEIVTRGFIYVKDSQALMQKSKKFITKSINKHMSKKKDWGAVKRAVERDLDRFLYKETGRNPMILVHSITV